MLRGDIYAVKSSHYLGASGRPGNFQQNRLPFHAHFTDQTSLELPLTVSLDGEWNFCYAENLTAPFTDWDTLTVPGFIQMQSLQKPGQPYGAPHYVNTQYPWDGHEKAAPRSDSAGL